MIAIVEAPISVEEVSRAVENPEAGAVVTFAGTVRRSSQGHTIQYLEYSAYKLMAERELRKVADEVLARWNLPCAIVHRVGRLEIGEASIVIAVASAHRHVAFEACHWAIDRVKETVPIWKKEVAVDGYWWVEDPLSGPGAVASSS
jgi:molybdopterin synthase catalytic subunit